MRIVWLAIPVHTVTLLVAATLASCSSVPTPPGVDDSTKRPLNHARVIELQRCAAELSASKAALAEAVDLANASSADARTSATRALTAAAQCRGATKTGDTLKPGQVYVIPFKVGSARIELTAAERELLLAEAGSAPLIVVRGRTDAPADSPSETLLARRRAEATAELLRRGGVAAERMRLQWQGSSDPSTRDQAPQRRSEVELYAAPPAVQALANRAL